MMTSREFLFRCMTSPRIKCVFCCQSCNSKKNHFDCQNLKPKSLPCIRILETLIRKMTIIIINYNWLFVLSCDNNLCHHFFGLQQKNIKWSHLRLIIMKVLNFSWPSEKQTNVLWFNYFEVFFCIMTDFEMVQCIHSYFNFSWKKNFLKKIDFMKYIKSSCFPELDKSTSQPFYCHKCKCNRSSSKVFVISL